MRCVRGILLTSFIYLCGFSIIVPSFQADGVVKRLVRVDEFMVDGRNPLNVAKCPENSKFVYLQAYSVCKKDVSNITNNTKVWFVNEHATATLRAGLDTDENNKASANQILKAYYNFCETSFNAKAKCVMQINKEESGADRFRTDFGLDCQNKGSSLFTGVTFCIGKKEVILPSESEGSAALDDEVVTLVGFKGLPLEPKCPEDRKITTLSAFVYGPRLTNKGLVDNFLDEAQKKCDGKDQCSLDFEDQDRFFRYRLYKYKCTE